MPNARVFRRILHRNTYDILWGLRSMLTMRIPMSLIPEPYPDTSFMREWGDPHTLDGVRLPNGNIAIYEVARLTSGRNPIFTPDMNQLGEVPYFVEDESYTTGHDLNTLKLHESYSWWIGVRREYTPNHELVTATPIDEKLVGVIRDQHNWIQKWTHPPRVRRNCETGKYETETTGVPVMDKILEAAGHGQTTYCTVKNDYLYLTCSFKKHYRKSIRRFTGELRQVLKFASANDIHIKIMKRVV